MFAARDQENLIHNRQTVAAGKPLNQNIRALHPKTPGNLKTPFRSARNDENQPLDFKGLKTGARDGPAKLDKGAFATPLAPRNRAPLGAKTTNAKAHAFQTPAPTSIAIKPDRTVHKRSTVRRSVKSKIAIAPSEPVETDLLANKVIEEEEPDFGYAPPPPVDLPDPPLELDEDPLLTDELRRGLGVPWPYASPKDGNGHSLRLTKEAEEDKKYDAERVKKSLKDLALPPLPSINEADRQVDNMITMGSKSKRPQLSRVDTMQAKSAASALCEPSTRPPSAAMKPTLASERRKKMMAPLPMTSKARVDSRAPTSNRLGPAAVSKNTIGFPKAKKAPSILPRGAETERSITKVTANSTKISQASIHPRDFRDRYGSPPEESDMWFRLKAYELLENETTDENDEGPADELFETDFFPFDNAKMDDEDFQLPMPE